MTNLEQQLASPIIADTAVLEERLERWKTRLNALTELQLPTDYPRRIHPHSHIHVVEAEKTFAMPEDLCTRLKQLASDMSREIEMSPVTPFTLVLSAFVILVHRYCGEDDIVVGSTSGVNPRVLRLAVSGALTFADVVRHVKEVGSLKSELFLVEELYLSLLFVMRLIVSLLIVFIYVSLLIFLLSNIAAAAATYCHSITFLSLILTHCVRCSFNPRSRKTLLVMKFHLTISSNLFRRPLRLP